MAATWPLPGRHPTATRPPSDRHLKRSCSRRLETAARPQLPHEAIEEVAPRLLSALHAALSPPLPPPFAVASAAEAVACLAAHAAPAVGAAYAVIMPLLRRTLEGAFVSRQCSALVATVKAITAVVRAAGAAAVRADGAHGGDVLALLSLLASPELPRRSGAGSAT